MTPKSPVTTPREELHRLLAASRFEIIPTNNAATRAHYLPSEAPVSITASPAKGIEATVSLAEELKQTGLDVVPHLAARSIENGLTLEDLLARLSDARIRRVFVVGGDDPNHGEFSDAGQLLIAIAGTGDGITDIGITGYPEGHPLIGEPALRAALVAKEPYASYVATQMCFDVPAIVSWIRSIRAAGIELPVYVGIPGRVDPVRLISIGTRIGVGASMRYVAKNRALAGKLVRRGAYRPTRLIHEIAMASSAEYLGIAGFHIFTFNETVRTADWWRGELDLSAESP